MKKGITLVAIIATVTILIVLLGTITITGTSSVNTAKLNTFATELLTLQNQLKQEKQKDNLEKILTGTIIIDISSFSNDERYQFSMEDISNNQVTLYQIDLVMIGTAKTTRGMKETEDDVYAYSKETGRVYYVKGIKVGKTRYYGLYGSLSNQTNVGKDDIRNSNEYVDRTILSDGIEIIKTSREYTNSWVSSEVRIPNGYGNVVVTSTEGIVSDYGINDNFSTFVITKSGANPVKYSINITYSVNGVTKNLKYDIDNIDVTPPVLSEGNFSQIYLIDTITGDKKALIKISGVTDAQSGIKEIKYEKGTVSNTKSYFASAGKIVENDLIPIEYSEVYTICAIDKAGNMTSIVLNINNDILQKLL